MTPANKLLLVRMDKIGDLVLSLPVDQAPVAKTHQVTWLISQGTGFVAQNAVPQRNFFELEKKFSWRRLWLLVHWLKTQNFSIAVVFYAPWWIGLALWLSRVPTRIGRLSRWHSFLFFNHGIRQSRKLGERHETDDNLSLLQTGLASPLSPTAAVLPLKLQPPETSLQNWPRLLPQNYIVVHPGMAGSALNWPVTCYAELIEQLCPLFQVVVTGTKMDRTYLDPLKTRLQNSATVQKVVWLNEQLNSSQLLTVLSQAKALVAPSTGVLHLAASLNTPTLGIYSPLPVQRPTRWGPRGNNVATLVSAASPAEALQSPEKAMAQIKVSEVLEALKNLLAHPRSPL